MADGIVRKQKNTVLTIMISTVFFDYSGVEVELLLAPGGISHSGPGENRQFWPDENSQS